MSLIDFLNEKKISWFPIHLSITDNNKKILEPYKENGKRPSYNDFFNPAINITERHAWIDNYEHIWIDTSKIQQIDVDGDFDPKLTTPYFLSVSKRKKHYFVTGFENMQKKRYQTKWQDVELLCGQGSYAKKDVHIYFPLKPILNFTSHSEVLQNTQNILECIQPNENALATRDTCDTCDTLATSTRNTLHTQNIENIQNMQEVGKKEYKNISRTASAALEKITGIEEKSWKIHTYRSSDSSFVCVPAHSKQCLVNKNKVHSTVQSWIVVSQNRCTAKCYSCCPSRKIQPKSFINEWNVLKQEFNFPVKDDISYDDLLDYLDEVCFHENLMKKDNFMMAQSPSCPIEYEPLSSFEDFLDDTFRSCENVPLKKFYRKPSVKDNLVKYLVGNHINIPLLKRDQNIAAFKNGYLLLDTLQFIKYDVNKKYTFISKKYFPFEFDTAWLSMKWTDIECPIFDKILKDQPQISTDPDISLVFHGFLGRLHYPIGSDPNDHIHAVPYFVGTSGTGKSTIVNIVSNTFSTESIGVLNYKEKIFGKTAFLNRDVIIDSDTPSNMIQEFGKTDFQKAVSGETIVIPVKNQKQESQCKIKQPMLFCSQYMQSVQDTGEVIRRIAYFGFEPVSHTKGGMDSECIKTELHKVFVKILLARKELLQRFHHKPFHEWGLDYFNSRGEDSLLENNPIYRMISLSENFVHRKDAKYPFQNFLDDFSFYYSNQSKKPKKPSSTDVIFTKLNFPIVKEFKCKECGKEYSPKCCKFSSPKNKITYHYILNLHKKKSASIPEEDHPTDLE